MSIGICQDIFAPVILESEAIGAPHPEGLVLRAAMQSGVAKLQSGGPETAMLIFRKMLSDTNLESESALAEEARTLAGC